MDKPLKKWRNDELSTFRAVLSQEQLLTFDFSVEEVVEMGRYPHKKNKPLDREIIAKQMDNTKITHLKKRYYTNLSGGEKQRTHLSRVLAQIAMPNENYSRILLLDEPTSALDLNHQYAVLQLCQQLRQEGITIFMIAHDLNLALRFSDEVILLNKGAILKQGTPDEVLTKPLIAEAFGVDVDIIHQPTTNRKLIAINAPISI